MTRRRHGAKPTLALWMLVAVADVALVVASAGVLAVLVGAGVAVTLAAGVAGAWQLTRRATARSEPTPARPLPPRRD
jgi:hypothetical protein